MMMMMMMMIARKSCGFRNERQYILSEEERAAQKEKRENEIKGDLIICKLCSQPRSRANVSRHRRMLIETGHRRDGELDGGFLIGNDSQRRRR